MSTVNGLLQEAFQLGPWQVYPRRHCLLREQEIIHLEPRVMQVLLRLAQDAGETVTREELMADVWMGAIVTDEAVTRAISTLRKALGDDYRNPRFIETLPKAGYRLMTPAVSLPALLNGPAPPHSHAPVYATEPARLPPGPARLSLQAPPSAATCSGRSPPFCWC